MIHKFNKHLSKNMIAYTFAVIILGLFLWKATNLTFLSKYILPVVFIMIYPMMINLSLTALKKIKWSKKPLIEAMFINFLYAPLIMYFLTSIFVSDPQISLALMLLSISPASSMGLGYIGLAKWNMLTWAIIVAFAFIASIFIYPIAGHYLALWANISIPFIMIIKNLLLILIVPLILWILTREYIERKHWSKKFNNIKHYFSTITLIVLYILIFIIFASKSSLILANYKDIFLLLPIAILFYWISVLLLLFVNKKIFKLEYGHHQSVVFTSISKNIALTIAILVSVFWKQWEYLAVFPAIMSLFQAPFLMIYLKFSKKIQKWFEI